MRKHFSFAVVCFSLLAVLQTLIESSVLMLRFHTHIFRPEDIFRVQLFSAVHWLLDLSKYASAPLVLDSHLGPRFSDKMPLVLSLLASYTIAGSVAAIACALIVSVSFKVRRKEVEDSQLFWIYCWISFSLCLSANLFSALIPYELDDHFPVFYFLPGLLQIGR